MYKLINGWYELSHNPNNLHKLWAPRLKWCEDTFVAGEWYMRDPMYEYIIHPTDNAKNQMNTTTPLTWMFRNKEDLLWFLLRWPDMDDI